MDNDPLGLFGPDTSSESDPLGLFTGSKIRQNLSTEPAMAVLTGLGRAGFNAVSELAQDVHGQASRLLYNLDLDEIKRAHIESMKESTKGSVYEKDWKNVEIPKYSPHTEIPWIDTKKYQSEPLQWIDLQRKLSNVTGGLIRPELTPAEKAADKALGDAWTWVKESAGSGAVDLQTALEHAKLSLPLNLGGIFTKIIENVPEEVLRSAVEAGVDFGGIVSMASPHGGKPGGRMPSTREALVADRQIEANQMNKQMAQEAASKQAAEEAAKAKEFQGVQEDPLGLFGAQTKFGAVHPEEMATDQYSGHPFNEKLSEQLAQEERSAAPAEQADMFYGTSPDNPIYPIEPSMPKKEVPDLGAGQTTEVYQQALRMNEKAGEDPTMGGRPFAGELPGETLAAADKPVLGPEPTTIEYKPHYRGPAATLGGVGKKEGGAILIETPQFLKDLARLIGREPKTLEGAKAILEAKLERAVDTRDTFMAPAYREKLKQIGELQAAKGQRGAVGDLSKKPGEVRDVGGEELAKLQVELEKEGPITLGRAKGKDLAKIESERAIINEAKAGNGKAFDTLFHATAPRLEKWARKFSLDADTIHDLVQDTMTTAWQKLEAFDPEKSQFNSWATNILKNKIIDEFRTRASHGEVKLTDKEAHMVEPAHFESPERILQTRQTGEAINRAWEKLDEKNRQMLDLRELHEMSYEQIADLLNMPINTVRTNIKRAREAFGGKLKGEGIRSPAGYFGNKQRGAIMLELPDFKKQVGSKGPAQAVKDMMDQFDISPEDLGKVVLGVKPENITDFDAKMDRTMLNVGIDKSISILSESRGPLGRIVKWAVDNRREIDRKSGVVIRDTLAKSLGPTSSWGKMQRAGNYGHTQLQNFVKVAIENIGKESTRDHFKSDTEFEAYKELQEVYEQVRQDLNTARSKYPGLKPLSKLEGYVPAMWEGDYVVVGKDGLGQTKTIHTFNTRLGATWMRDKLAEKHPELDFTWFEHGDSKFNLKDLSAFEETLRTLDKNDPTYQAVRATYLDILSKRSMGRHAATKTGVGGFMGTEGGKLGVTNFEKAHEQYVKGAYNYIANLEKQALKEQLANLDPSIREKIPNGLAYMNEYLNMAKGADISTEQLIRGLAEYVSSYIGTGKSGPQKALGQISSLASMWWLATPRFYLANMVQSINSLPKIVEIAGREGFEGANPMHAMWEGITQTFSPDVVAKEAMAWAEKGGYMESSMVSMFNLSLADLHQSRLGVLGDIASWSQQKWEHHAVRTPSFLAFEYLLRDSIPNKETRFQRAAEMMDYYMVHYDKASAPLMYEKMGVLGDVARPLKQYAHNSWGQFFEFVQTAKNEGRYAPVATMLGVQAAVAGVRGAILVAEATAIITAINALFGQDIPTPEKILFGVRNWMKKSVEEASPIVKKGVGNLADALVYGGYSTALGVDISSSVNAPGLPQMFSLAPANFAYKAVKDSATYLIKTITGTATSADAMQMLLSTSPSMARGFIEELYSKPGQPVPRPSEQMKGNYVRSPTEKWVANLLSLKSINEASANDLVRVAKATAAQDAQEKMTAINAIISDVREGNEIRPENIKRYVLEGGNIANLSKEILRGMKGQALTYDERMLQGSMTPAKIQRLKEMKELLDNKEYGITH